MDEDFPALAVASPIKVDGGVSQNNFVTQFVADICGRELVRVAAPSRVTALGAAYFAGLGAGIWKSKEEIRDLEKIERRFSPSFDDGHSEVLMSQWRRAIHRAAKWLDT